MRDVIVLDDDDEFMESKSQVQRGLSEVQKSRMMEQKQLALARLQAKKQQTQLPDNTTVLPQQANPASDELGSRSWAGDYKVAASTSTSKGWRAGPTSERWEHFRPPNQGYHDPPSSGPSSHSTSRNADVRWDDIINDPTSRASSDRSTRVVPNRNQGCWDADFDRDTQDVSGSSGFQQNSAHVPTEVVGEWKSVRKRPAPGSSFGIQMTASSGHFKPSSELETWQIFKSPKTSPDVKRFENQIPGIEIEY